jgi:hypothetical protein
MSTAVTPLNQDDKTWGMLAHLSGLAGYLIPFGNVIAPLVIWLAKRDTSPYVGDQAKEALNFQITVTLAFLVCIPLMFIIIGIPLAFAVGIGALVLLIIAAIKAYDGVGYRYPLTLRLVS